MDTALSSAPAGFKLYDVDGEQTHDLSGDNVYFTPGSAAINILDDETGEMRKPDTADYVRYAKLVAGLDAHRLPEHGLHPRRRARADLRQLPALPEPALLREAGGHRRLHRSRPSR